MVQGSTIIKYDIWQLKKHKNKCFRKLPLNLIKIFVFCKGCIYEICFQWVRRKFSYGYQNSPTEDHIWKWLKNIIEIFLLHLYLYTHICCESCKKNQHGVNQKNLVSAHTIPLDFNLISCFLLTLMTSNIPIINTHSSVNCYGIG